MTIVVHRAGKLVGYCALGMTIGHLATYLPLWGQVVFIIAALVALVVTVRRMRVLAGQMREVSESMDSLHQRMIAEQEWAPHDLCDQCGAHKVNCECPASPRMVSAE